MRRMSRACGFPGHQGCSKRHLLQVPYPFPQLQTGAHSIAAANFFTPLRISCSEYAAYPSTRPPRPPGFARYVVNAGASTPSSRARRDTTESLFPFASHASMCMPASCERTSTAPRSSRRSASSNVFCRSRYSIRIRRTCRAMCPSAMNSASTACSTVGLWRSITAFVLPNASTSCGGTMTYPSRSDGNNTLLNVPQ